MLRTLLLCLITTFSAVCMMRSQDGPRSAVLGVDMSYVLEERPHSLHEPVVLTFKASNHLPNAIVLDLGQDRENGFTFRLLRPDGTTADSPSFTRNGISLIGTAVLRSGESLSQEVILNDRFRFDVPGNYKIAGHLTQEIMDEQGDKLGSDPGFQKDIEIVPRDESSLRKVCQELSGHLERSNSYSDAALIARELATIDDPVAVPFLDKALRADRLVEPFIISALVRIGNTEAANALIAALNGKTGAAADAVLRGLTQIRLHTSDPLLRELIDRALLDYQPQRVT
jgi:hypothetical protein